jgi:DNA invertase Pin-like site-specific DNA recombinase
MKTQKQNAMIYCRADLNENTSEILNALNQENEVLNFCKHEGFNVVEKFIDYTTPHIKSQPELQRMKDFAMQSEITIDVVVCWGFDRISRDIKELLDIVFDFNQMSIDVISVEQIINLKNKTNEQNK